jgi:hypothetical protein
MSDKISIMIREDGIARVVVAGVPDIDVWHVKYMVEKLEEAGKGKKFPLLLIVGANTMPTLEARAYIAKPESIPNAIAEAYVIKSFTQKLAGSIYLSFNKPARPTRIFTDETKAVDWLKTFL